MPAEPNPLEGRVSYSNPEQALGQTGVGHAVAQQQAARRAQQAAGSAPKPAPAKPQTYVKDKDDPFANVGRNDPCPCGSGLKFMSAARIDSPKRRLRRREETMRTPTPCTQQAGRFAGSME